MSTRRHKRRRVDKDLALDEALSEPASPADDTQETQVASDREPSEEAPTEGGGDDLEAFAKETEIWDAFREEHYEGM